MPKKGYKPTIEHRERLRYSTKKRIAEGKGYFWIKGYIPWNKNKKMDDNSKIKISLSLKKLYSEGKRVSEFKKKKYHGMKQSEQTKKKLSIIHKGRHYSKRTEWKVNDGIIKKLRAKQVLPTKDTKIEIKIQNFLKEMNIEFFTHQYIKIEHGYQCDIFIPSFNLVIECDGDYWHSYPTGREIDFLRTKELIEKGFKVLRLWEFEINDLTIEKFKIKLEDFK